jgi:hypothetical protein
MGWLLLPTLLAMAAGGQANRRYYGSGIQFDVLNNQPVKKYDVDYRFRAEFSGSLKSFNWYDAYGRSECDGYGCGTGGKIEICLFADDGQPQHLWTGKPLACVSPANLRRGDKLREDAFSQPPRLQAGQLYHLHWHNADPEPEKNFISVDDTCVWRPITPRQPTIPDTDLAVISGSHGVETDTPILQLTYDNGATQGQGYKESWNYTAETISGASKVRESFTVNGPDRLVTEVAVRLNRVRGSSPLDLRLETGAGEMMEEGSIAPASFPEGRPLTQDPWDSQNVMPAWGRLTFRKPLRLKSGQSYHLLLSTAPDTVYQAYGIQRASGYGFSVSTYFADGRGEASRDNGVSWTGFRQTETSLDHRDADIQFYFSLL